MRKVGPEECERIIAQIQDLSVNAAENASKLELIRQIVAADPHELALIEKALSGEPGRPPTQPGSDLDTVYIDDIEELSPQLKSIIKRKGYTTLADLAKFTEAELRERSGFQDRSIVKIRAALEARGHKLE